MPWKNAKSHAVPVLLRKYGKDEKFAQTIMSSTRINEINGSAAWMISNGFGTKTGELSGFFLVCFSIEHQLNYSK